MISSNWRIWEGQEIESSIDYGVKTLFIRDASLEEINKFLNNYSRVWFCEQFNNWDIIRKVKSKHENVNVSVYIEDYNFIPVDIKKSCRIYLKIRDLKKGDVVGVGKDYFQEFFVVGNGDQVKSELYNSDRNLL